MAREVIISCWWPWSWCTSEFCVVHSTIRVVCLKQHWWPRSRDKPFFPLQLWQRVKLFPSILAAVCVWKLLFARSYFSSDRSFLFFLRSLVPHATVDSRAAASRLSPRYHSFNSQRPLWRTKLFTLLSVGNLLPTRLTVLLSLCLLTHS